MKPLIPFVVMLLLGGCSVGPDYQRPAVAMPVHYKEAKGWQQTTPLDAQSKALLQSSRSVSLLCY